MHLEGCNSALRTAESIVAPVVPPLILLVKAVWTLLGSFRLQRFTRGGSLALLREHSDSWGGLQLSHATFSVLGVHRVIVGAPEVRGRFYACGKRHASGAQDSAGYCFPGGLLGMKGVLRQKCSSHSTALSFLPSTHLSFSSTFCVWCLASHCHVLLLMHIWSPYSYLTFAGSISWTTSGRNSFPHWAYIPTSSTQSWLLTIDQECNTMQLLQSKQIDLSNSS